jgi:alkaline phosphatase
MFRESELDRVHAFYERYGRLTVFWCRFIPFIRGVAAFPAGISRMPKRYFLVYTALGSGIFCFGLAGLGEFAGKRLDSIIEYVHSFGLLALAITLVLAVAGFVWWRVTRAKGPARTS